MAQVDYYKFFKKFPRFIDIDNTDVVKLVLLNETKRMKSKLLPINLNSTISVDELRESGFKDVFKVTYKRRIIIHVFVTLPEFHNKLIDDGLIKDVKQTEPVVIMYKPHYNYNKEEKIFLSKEEVTNIKRTIVNDDMLKK